MRLSPASQPGQVAQDFTRASSVRPSSLPLPSRYCQSDQLGRFAGQKFGSITDAYDQVLEIMKWIHDNVEYVPGTTTSVTSAYDTVTQCSGVCRDFARLGIALSRALTIPCPIFRRLRASPQSAGFPRARRGVHRYWVLHATRLAPPNGLVRIGLGRDAADVSVCNAFGIARSLRQGYSVRDSRGKLLCPHRSRAGRKRDLLYRQE